MAVTVTAKRCSLPPARKSATQQNLIIVPMSIPLNGALADYTLNAQGQIFRVWLLTPAEQARRKPAGGG